MNRDEGQDSDAQKAFSVASVARCISEYAKKSESLN